MNSEIFYLESQNRFDLLSKYKGFYMKKKDNCFVFPTFISS